MCCDNTPFCLEEGDFQETHEGDWIACVVDSGLWGSFPAEFSSFRDLQVLDLSSNLLSGTIPISIGAGGGLPLIEILNLSDNKLTGEVPISLASVGNGRSEILLENNSFR